MEHRWHSPMIGLDDVVVCVNALSVVKAMICQDAVGGKRPYVN